MPEDDEEAVERFETSYAGVVYLINLAIFLEIYGDGRGVKMTSAALDAGFGSYPQFHRVFRERMGCAPAEHARRLRGA